MCPRRSSLFERNIAPPYIYAEMINKRLASDRGGGTSLLPYTPAGVTGSNECTSMVPDPTRCELVLPTKDFI